MCLSLIVLCVHVAANTILAVYGVELCEEDDRRLEAGSVYLRRY
jgi:hypothetical protein